MPLFHLIILALIQGVTEFLPISSSGHLILFPVLTGVADQGLIIDVAVHVGTLGAVCFYFWRDLARLATAAFVVPFQAPEARGGSEQAGALKLLGSLIVASVPVVIVGGLLLLTDIPGALRRVDVIGWTSLIFGIALYVADRWGPVVRRLDDLGWRQALAIGLAQSLALVPGTSRAGITMTAARAFGFSRSEAARFSMLLSIPTIMAAGGAGVIEIIAAGDASLGLDGALAGVLAFGTALITIRFFMRWLERATLTPFVAYRIVLGVVLLAWAYG